MTRRASPEEQIQKAMVEWLDLIAPRASWRFFHVPNGGKRPTKINAKGQRYSPAGAALKAMGAKPGITDLVFLYPVGRVGVVEVKTPERRNDLSTAQRKFKDFCIEAGIPWAVACSVDELRARLESWGLVDWRGAAT